MALPEGILTFNKPVGITSADALYRVRSIARQRKSGHAGSLDPGASGVLVLCLGKATKLVESIMDQPKVYRATARLDVISKSHDSDRPLTSVEVSTVPTADAVREAFDSFEGEIKQVPPRISAVKVGGIPSYVLAGHHEDIPLAPRSARIYWIHIHAYRFPELDFEMCCGRGTYVRSLIRDLGKNLGTGGCLTSLVRRSVGPFHEDDAWTFERLEAAPKPQVYLTDVERARALLDPSALKIPDRPARELPPVETCIGRRRMNRAATVRERFSATGHGPLPYGRGSENAFRTRSEAPPAKAGVDNRRE